MKKQILLISLVLIAFSLNAQLYLNETFNYSRSILSGLAGDPAASATNNLVGVWYNTGKTSDSNSGSIAIYSEPLYYTGYINSGLGKSAKIDWAGAGTNTRVDVIRFISHADKISAAGNVLYYSFLMNVENIRSFTTSGGIDANDWRDVLCVTEGGSDVLGNSFRGRFFLQQDADDPNLIRYSISKNTAFTSSAVPDAYGEISANQTYLMVIKQTFTGDGTCKVEVIHNPPLGNEEPTERWINGKTSDTNTFGGTYGVALRRRNLGSTANVLIGGLRVAKTYPEAIGFTTGLFNKHDIHNIYVAENNIVTGEAGKITVYSFSGSELISTNTDGKLPVSLNSGNYLVRFTDMNGTVSSNKIQIR